MNNQEITMLDKINKTLKKINAKIKLNIKLSKKEESYLKLFGGINGKINN